MDIAVGIVGALVMPHNIFLHSALVQSRKIDLRHAGAKKEAIVYNAIESAASLSITVIINLSVMSVFSSGFHNNVHAIPEVGLSTAGRYATARPPSPPPPACGQEIPRAMRLLPDASGLRPFAGLPVSTIRHGLSTGPEILRLISIHQQWHDIDRPCA